MPNGHAVASALVPDPDPIELEQELGDAMGHAILALCVGMDDYAAIGAFRPGLRATGGRARGGRN
jgi:hypothetical protein